MGNSSSTSNSAKNNEPIPHKKQIKDLYEDLCDVGILSQKKFEEHFKSPSEIVSKNLFERFFIDLLNSDAVTKSLFIERTHLILESAYKSKEDQLLFYVDLLSENMKQFDEDDLKRIVTDCQHFGLLQHKLNENDEKISNDLAENEVSVIEKDQSDDGVVKSKSEELLNNAILKSSSICVGTSLKEKFMSWSEENCPSIFQGLQSWLLFKFTGTLSKFGIEMLPVPFECGSSNTQLNPSLLWFLCCILPSCFTNLQNQYKVNEDEDEGDREKSYTWNLLYDSNQHGLSLNRFKHRVMNYKSPTVTIVTFNCGLKIALGLDEAWKDSPDKFGGPYCMLIEISPVLQVVETNSNMFYLKENGRSIPTGLVVGSETRPKLSISKDLQNAQINYKQIYNEEIQRMEVWGCGGVEAIKTQKDMKKWESKEIEKRKKVKLPGQWDQDKTILEMGGVTVNHSQRGDM